MRLAAVAAIVAVISSACGPGADPPDGRELYLSYGCAACHGTTGDGRGPASKLAHVKPRDLRDVKAFAGPQTAEGIASTIAFGVAEGRTGMPAYPDIPKGERMAIARYVLSLANAPRGISVSNAWTRAPNPASRVTAGYLTITNHEPVPVSLVAVSSPSAPIVEMHEIRIEGGTMSMRPVRRITIPAGSGVSLEPGGTHLMLIDVDRNVRAGSTVDLLLQFDNGRSENVKMAVKDVD